MCCWGWKRMWLFQWILDSSCRKGSGRFLGRVRKSLGQGMRYFGCFWLSVICLLFACLPYPTPSTCLFRLSLAKIGCKSWRRLLFLLKCTWRDMWAQSVGFPNALRLAAFLQTGWGDTHCSNLLSGSWSLAYTPRVLRFTFPVRLLQSVSHATLPDYVEADNTP